MKMLYFSAPWCGPCKAMRPLVDNLSGVEVERIDIDEHPMRAAQLHVRSVPTLILLNGDGAVVRRHTGVMTPDALQGFATAPA